MKKFEELGLSKELLKVIGELKFTEPSEIQEKAIPLALTGRDIVGGSSTGSGKTLAFSAPILERIKPNKTVQALILTPTRELAEQITNAMRDFSRYKDIRFLSVYGGVDIEAQIRRIPRSDVIIGTPGRVLDHIERRTLNLSNVKFLVLDEVDRMLDMGFSRDVEKIIKLCPEKRQTFLFSATLSKEIEHLIKKYTINPAEISVKSYVDHSKLKQVYYEVPSDMKFSLLVYLLKKEKADLVMVFSNTRRNADLITGNLLKLGINAQAIHGGLTQSKRLRVLEDFHKKGVGVLICTDVAARGLDIKGVTHVYNYDIPDVANDYTHRIGRTARAGSNGIAINLITKRDSYNFENVLKNKEFNITKEEMPEIEKVDMDIRAGNKREITRLNKREGSSFNQSRDNRRERNLDRDSRPRRNFRDDSKPKFNRRSSGKNVYNKRREMNEEFVEEGRESKPRRTFRSDKPKFNRRSSGKSVYNKRREMNEEFVEEGREYKEKRRSFGKKSFKKSFGSRKSSDDDSNPRRSFGEGRKSSTRSFTKKPFLNRNSRREDKPRFGRNSRNRSSERETSFGKKRESSGPRINRDSKYKRTPSRDAKHSIKKRR